MTVVVALAENVTYRTLPRNFAISGRWPPTLEESIKKHVLAVDDRVFFVDQNALMASLMAKRDLPTGWRGYQSDRYGWGSTSTEG